MLGELRERFNTTLSQVSAKSPMALAIGYSLSNWTALTRFVGDGRIEAHTRSALLHLRALQALDAAHAGASYRESAQALFGLEAVVLRWHEDGELRAQIRHLLRRALAYMNGGYRALAEVRRTEANPPGDEMPR